MKSILKAYWIIFLICGFYLMFPVFWQDIWSLSASFCNDWQETKSLKISTNSAKTNEICINFSNSSDKDLTINVGYPDWEETTDEFKNKACKVEWDIWNFGQYMTDYSKSITIPARSTIIEKSHIKFPAWFEGMVHWCLTYYIKNSQKTNPENMLNIVVRKTNFIDILVWWKYKREISLLKFDKSWFFWTNKKIQTNINKTNWKLQLNIHLSNSWDVDETLNATWSISNLFWFNKTFSLKSKKIKSNSEQLISIEVWNLPFYKWSFNINLILTSEPEIIFNKSNLPENLKSKITIKEFTKITIIPYSLIWRIILILWLFFIFKKTNIKKTLDLIKKHIKI